MDDFIKKAAAATGVDEAQVKHFVGMVLDYVNKQTGDDVTKEIEAKIGGAKELAAGFDSFEIESIPRKDNKRADELANHAMDMEDSGSSTAS